MKKKLIALSVATLLSSTAAFADETYTNPDYDLNSDRGLEVMGYGIKPYIGLEAGLFQMDFEGSASGVPLNDIIPTDHYVASPYIGFKFGDYLGIEASYTFGNKEKTSNATIATDTTNMVNGYNADLMGYLPLDEKKAFSLIAMVGVGHYEFETIGYNSGGAFPVGKNDTVLRYGGGVEYKFADSWSTRLLYRVVDFDLHTVEPVNTYNLGLSYMFN